jgi:hypothetical protein
MWPNKQMDDEFELWISKRLQVPLNIDEDRASEYLGSISLIRSSDQQFEKPVILYGPQDSYKSPKGSISIQATNEAIEDGRLKVLYASPETRRVKVQKLNETTVNTYVNTDTHNIYTLTKGNLEPFVSSTIKDNTILANDEGLFLIRVVETEPTKASSIVGVREKPDMIPQLAFGTAQIINAR